MVKLDKKEIKREEILNNMDAGRDCHVKIICILMRILFNFLIYSIHFKVIQNQQIYYVNQNFQNFLNLA